MKKKINNLTRNMHIRDCTKWTNHGYKWTSMIINGQA